MRMFVTKKGARLIRINPSPSAPPPLAESARPSAYDETMQSSQIARESPLSLSSSEQAKDKQAKICAELYRKIEEIEKTYSNYRKSTEEEEKNLKERIIAQSKRIEALNSASASPQVPEIDTENLKSQKEGLKKEVEMLAANSDHLKQELNYVRSETEEIKELMSMLPSGNEELLRIAQKQLSMRQSSKVEKVSQEAGVSAEDAEDMKNELELTVSVRDGLIRDNRQMEERINALELEAVKAKKQKASLQKKISGFKGMVSLSEMNKAVREITTKTGSEVRAMETEARKKLLSLREENRINSQEIEERNLVIEQLNSRISEISEKMNSMKQASESEINKLKSRQDTELKDIRARAQKEKEIATEQIKKKLLGSAL